MPYPFTGMPTVRGFIDVAEGEFGAELLEIVRSEALPNEAQVLRYLRRTVEGRKLRSWMPLPEDSQRLTPSELRNHCQALEIPLTRFGLDLAEPDW